MTGPGFSNVFLDQLGHMTCPYWGGVWSCDNLTNMRVNHHHPLAIVVNLAPASQPIGHFIALLLKDGAWQMFDPAGLPVAQSINEHLQRFIDEQPATMPVTCWRQPTIQHSLSDFCAIFCLAFLLARLVHGMSVQEFYQMFIPFPSMANNDIALTFLLHVLRKE